MTTTHCHRCGSTDPVDVGPDAIRENEGETACCGGHPVTDHSRCKH